MTSKPDIIKLAHSLYEINVEKLHFNKNRLTLLLRRSKKVVDRVEKQVDTSKNFLTVSQALALLYVTLEEILEYAILFSNSDKQLAAHIVKYGSDEEQFTKWNERLQHCIAELQLDMDVFDVFNESSDFHAFEKDVALLKDKDEMIKIIQLLHGANDEGLVKSIDVLVNHQSNVRSTYQTITAPDASLEIDPKRVKYEVVIGHGGKFGFINRVWCGMEGKV
jgi:hypothetical protein